MAITFNQIDAITTNKFLRKLTDNVYFKHQFLRRLTRPGQLRLKDGGVKIQVPIISSKPGSGGYFEGFDTLNITPTDDITAATFDWKQLVEPIHISRKEMLQNSGDSQKLSLVASKMEVAENQIRRNLTLGLFSDGTAATGALTTKQITGLQATLNQTSATTYGGISEDDLSDWVGVSKGASGVNRPLTLNLLQQTWQAASDGAEKTTVLTMRGNIYDQLWALYQPHQRLQSDKEMAALGFKNIPVFNGAPIIIDENMKANTIYLLNEDFLFLCVHRQENLRIETINGLETSNSMLKKIFWMGELVTSQRRRQAELADIEASA